MPSWSCRTPAPLQRRASTDVATARLREVIQGGAPFGSLGLKVHVAPQFADSGPARALVTVRVDADTAVDAATIDLLVLAADDAGKVGSIERFAMSRPTSDAAWEGSITLTLERGPYQLRIAASTPDGTRTGLLLHPIDMRPPAGDLLLGVPTLLGEDASRRAPHAGADVPGRASAGLPGRGRRRGRARMARRRCTRAWWMRRAQAGRAGRHYGALRQSLAVAGHRPAAHRSHRPRRLHHRRRGAVDGGREKRSRTHAIPITLAAADRGRGSDAAGCAVHAR